MPMRQRTQRLLQRHALVDLGIDIAAGEPIIAQLGPAVQVDGRDDTHVGLAPLAAAVRDLVLEQLERVEAQLRLRDFEALPQELRRFVRDEHQVAVRLVLAHFLHNAQVVDAAEERTPREVGDGFGGEFVGGEAELVDFWRLRDARCLGLCFCCLVTAKFDGRWCGIIGVWLGFWWIGLFGFFDTKAGVGAAEVEETMAGK